MHLNYQDIRLILQLIVIAINLSLWFFVWNSNKNKVTKEQLETHAVQLAHIEERLKSAVGHPELKPLYERMNNMDRQLSEIKGKMHTLDLIHEFLINKEK